MDHICDSFNSVGAGIDNRLHDGRRHSYPFGHCRRCVAGPGYSRTKTSVTVSILTESNETFQKEVIRKSGNISPNLAITSAEKSLQATT